MTTTPTTLVARPLTGEALDLHAATDEDLAVYLDEVQQARDRIAEHEDLVRLELTARLDRSASWTRRVGDPAAGAQWEIKAPSPDAGTVVYDPDTLLVELQALVERGTIDAGAAGGALKRWVTITARVGLDVDLPELASTVRRAAADDDVDVEIAGVGIAIEKVDYGEQSVVAGIKALAKVPGTKSALARASRTVPAGDRRAKVKRVERGA